MNVPASCCTGLKFSRLTFTLLVAAVPAACAADAIWIESAVDRPAARLLLPVSSAGSVAWRFEEVNDPARNGHRGFCLAGNSAAQLFPVVPLQPVQPLAAQLASPPPAGFVLNPLRLFVVPVFSAESKAQRALVAAFADAPAMRERWSMLKASGTGVSVVTLGENGVLAKDCSSHSEFVNAVQLAGNTSSPALVDRLTQLLAMRAKSAIAADALREIPVLLIVWAENSVKLPDGVALAAPAVGLPVGVRGACLNIAAAPLWPVGKMREFVLRSGLAYEAVTREKESGEREFGALIGKVFTTTLPAQLAGWSTVMLESSLVHPGLRRTFLLRSPTGSHPVAVDLSAAGQQAGQVRLLAALRQTLTVSGADAFPRLDDDFLVYLDARNQTAVGGMVADYLGATIIPQLATARQFAKAQSHLADFRKRFPTEAAASAPRLTLLIENGIAAAIAADTAAAKFATARELIALLPPVRQSAQSAALLHAEGLHWLKVGEHAKGEAALEKWYEIGASDKDRLVAAAEAAIASAAEPSLLRWVARLRAVRPALTPAALVPVARWLAETSGPEIALARAAALGDVELAFAALTPASASAATAARALAWLQGATGRLDAWRGLIATQLATAAPDTDGAQTAARFLAELARTEATLPLAVAFSSVAAHDRAVAVEALAGTRALPLMADWNEGLRTADILPVADASLASPWAAWLAKPGRILLRRHEPAKEGDSPTWSLLAATGVGHVCRLVWSAVPDRDSAKWAATLASAAPAERSAPGAALRVAALEAAVPAALMLIAEAARLAPAKADPVALLTSVRASVPAAFLAHALIYKRNTLPGAEPGSGAIADSEPRNLPASVAGNARLNEAAGAFVLPAGEDGIIETGVPLMTAKADAAAGGRPYFEASGMIRLGLKNPANR